MAGGYVVWFAGRYVGQATLRRWGRYVWLRNEDGFHGPTYVIAGILAVAVLIAIAVFLRRRRRERAEAAPAFLEPYHRVAQLALFGSVRLTLLILVGIYVMTGTVIGHALNPVAQMSSYREPDGCAVRDEFWDNHRRRV